MFVLRMVRVDEMNCNVEIVRVLTFVRGLSNYGQGMLSIPEKDLLAPQTTFYKEKVTIVSLNVHFCFRPARQLVVGYV